MHLVTICGSLRTGSYNAALLAALPTLASEGTTFERLAWGDVPVYNHDVELLGMPESVARLREAIRAADGIIIASPEYNHSVPGGLKNLMDWLSRPPAPHAFFGMPSAILGASDGVIGTARMQNVLRQSLVTLNSPAMPFPQVLVNNAQHKVDTSGKLTDVSTLDFMRGWMLAAETWMRRFPKAVAA